MMKQSLVALAVFGASGLAAAQSSVTLYGVADAGIGRIKTPVFGSRIDPVTGVQAQALDANGQLRWDNKTRFISASTMNNADSRVGFTGVEDIGGGGKVGFQFETGLSLEDGSSDASFWQRQANVFVGGDWGTIKAGRQLTVTHLTEGAYELTGLANYSVVRNTFLANGFAPRADAAIAYISPNMGGLTAAVAFASKNNDPYASNVWDVGVMYAGGPISVGAAVNNGLDNGKKNYHVGAKYSFGNYAVAASYHHGTSDGIRAAEDMGHWFPKAQDRVRRGLSIGGQARFGALTVTLDMTRDTRNEWSGKWSWQGDPATGSWVWNTRKYTNALLEGKYALSKRTFLYGAVLRLDGATNWGVGINHGF